MWLFVPAHIRKLGAGAIPGSDSHPPRQWSWAGQPPSSWEVLYCHPAPCTRYSRPYYRKEALERAFEMVQFCFSSDRGRQQTSGIFFIGLLHLCAFPVVNEDTYVRNLEAFNLYHVRTRNNRACLGLQAPGILPLDSVPGSIVALRHSAA